jgi:hypothetical protein
MRIRLTPALIRSLNTMQIIPLLLDRSSRFPFHPEGLLLWPDYQYLPVPQNLTDTMARTASKNIAESIVASIAFGSSYTK